MTAAGERCIAITVASALYGLPVDEVQEVIGIRPLTRVFHAPDVIAGVTNLRGDVLPVLDLGLLLGGAPRIEGATDARIVVVRERAGAQRRAGFCVAELRGLRDFPASGLGAVPATLTEPARSYVSGIIPTSPPCAVLSVTAVLDSPAIVPFATRDATR
ncbi:MAG: chemotaxis protein CheW [Polyangiaceae bacterium]|nr:chemotaxis protein CheW [Polyangiaceae bacterium]